MVKKNNIAELQRELNAYIIEGNDVMVERIQELIDKEIKARDNITLNEVMPENHIDLNTQVINE